MLRTDFHLTATYFGILLILYIIMDNNMDSCENMYNKGQGAKEWIGVILLL